MINHGDVIAELHVANPPARTLDGALAFLIRACQTLMERYPQDGPVGLLIKTAGENIVPYNGTSVSAGRICYPKFDLLVKILSDVPTTNGPSWQPEEGIPNSGHHGGYLAVGGSVPDVPDTPDDTQAIDLATIKARLSNAEQGVAAQKAWNDEVAKQIGAINESIKALSNRPQSEPPKGVPDHYHTAGRGWATINTSGPKT